jgi:hypothetical protein
MSAITSGQTITASIAAKAEIDTYTINGVAGGSIMATVGETVSGSALAPLIKLLSPTGTTLTLASSATGSTITQLNLPTTGTYKVTVQDYYGTGTGGYAVTAVSIGAGISLNSGGDGGAATSAATRTAAIGVGDIDAFTLNGVAGGSLMATVGETTAGSSLSPLIELYSPTGQRLTLASSATGSTITQLNLPATGTYTITVRDYYGTGTGGYAITPVSIGPGIAQDSGGDAGATTSALTRSASIGIGDIDVFTISGVAGGTMMATVGETTAGSTLSPLIELYSPTGTRLTLASSATGSTITQLNLPATGTYTITVRDYYGTGVGGYAMTPVSLASGIAQNAGGDAGATTSATTRTATIGIGDIDAFTLNGVAGGTIMATVAETTAGSSLSPLIELYSPTGARLTLASSATGSTITQLNLPATGTYTLTVRDYYGTGVGGYAMTAVSIGAGISQDAGGDAGATTSGVTRTASLPAGDIDVFTLGGVAGGTIMATVGETVAGSALSPLIELYSPTGSRLTLASSATGSTITQLNLPATGTYTITVRDYYGNGIGGYAMTPVSIGTGISQDAGGDGGFLPSGSTRTATIGIGDIDAHPFWAVPGDKIDISVAESVAGSALSPLLELYSPSGARINLGSSATSVTLPTYTATTYGIYTITIRDYYGTGTGGYKLNLVEIPSATKPTITIAATDNLAVEGGFDNGTFTITRTNIRALPVSVGYSISGTAKNGVDYTMLTGTAVIQPNQASVAVNVSALTDTLKENSETVILTLKTGSIYNLGTAKSATVTIDDPATVSGFVFNDLDGSGGRNGSEPGLSGWTVFIDTNGDGILDNGERSVVTDSTGAWKFTGLAPGTIKLRVKPQTNFTQTDPAGGAAQSVTLTLGGTTTGVLFGEKKIA